MKLDLSKISIPIRQSNPKRPPQAVWDSVNNEWKIRVDYGNNPIAGNYVILSANGSAKQVTIDEGGNLINEFNLNEKEKGQKK